MKLQKDRTEAIERNVDLLGTATSRESLVEECRAYIQSQRCEGEKKLLARVEGWKIVLDWSDAMDRLLRRLLEEAEREFFRRHPRLGQRCSLVALGGYGRRELCPYSDIDLLFLYPYKLDEYVETIAEKLLYLLWDCSLNVGYSTRSIKGCTKIALEDLTVRNALIDSRFIAGDRKIFDEFIEEAFPKVFYQRAESFVEEKWKEMQSRHQKFGSSVYILEPQLKEGPGGLRDIHAILWACKAKFKMNSFRDLLQKGIISERQFKTLTRSWDFQLRTRIALHYYAGRRQDQLTFETQEPLAEKLGFKKTRRGPAVEGFLHTYYAHANTIRQFTEDLFERLRENSRRRALWTRQRKILPSKGFEIRRGKLYVTDLEQWKREPLFIIKTFQIAQKYDVELSSSARELIRDSLSRVDEAYCQRSDVREIWNSMLSQPRGLSRTLLQMHELKFLGRYIPEFSRLYRKAQHDLYHVYTVDIHSIFAVREFEKLYLGEYQDSYPLLSEICQGIQKIKILILGILFHDIGKGLGGGHVIKGMQMMPQIARRLGLSSEEEETIRFLIEHHLLFSHIAQRRDLHDEKLIIRFARTLETLERLQMLYLLTFSDVRAVGPDVWNHWKEMLFQELYLRTLAVFQRGHFKPVGEKRIVDSVREQAKDVLLLEYSRREVEEFLDSFDPKYFLYSNPSEVVRDFRLDKSLAQTPVALEKWDLPRKRYSEITVATYDRPGLFSEIAGVLSANGINILGAQIHLRKNDRILDVFQANDQHSHSCISDANRWERVKQDMLAVVQQDISVDELLRSRMKSIVTTRKKSTTYPSKVVIDNEDSEQYTVIEVYTADQPGLLYLITRSLFRSGLNIDLAKVSTKVDQVADVFYVKSLQGEKITSQDRLDKIRAELLSAIGPGS